MAIAEKVHNLIWSPRPEKFGPQEVWSLRNLVPKKFESRIKIITWLFHAGAKFLKDQIFWGPKKSGANMWSETISVIAPKIPQFIQGWQCFQINLELAGRFDYQCICNTQYRLDVGKLKTRSRLIITLNDWHFYDFFIITLLFP